MLTLINSGLETNPMVSSACYVTITLLLSSKSLPGGGVPSSSSWLIEVGCLEVNDQGDFWA